MIERKEQELLLAVLRNLHDDTGSDDVTGEALGRLRDLWSAPAADGVDDCTVEGCDPKTCPARSAPVAPAPVEGRRWKALAKRYRAKADDYKVNYRIAGKLYVEEGRKLDAARAELAELKRAPSPPPEHASTAPAPDLRDVEIKRLRDALDRDKTGLAAGLDECRKIARGYWWVTEGRGCYEWDDDRYRGEMANLVKAIIGVVEKSLRSSGDLAMAVLRDGATVTPPEAPKGETAPHTSARHSFVEGEEDDLCHRSDCRGLAADPIHTQEPPKGETAPPGFRVVGPGTDGKEVA